MQGCSQIQKEVSRGHGWLINVDEIKASGTNQILFLQPNDFLKTICWVIMINPKENLASSAFNSIYEWLGHRDGKIITLLMGWLLSTKLPFECL